MTDEKLGVIPFFYSAPVENQAESRKQGRPIFRDCDMVKLRYIGDKTRELHMPVRERFIRGADNRWLTPAEVFAEQFKAWKAGQDYHEAGTPLAEVPFLTEARRAELRALNVFTLEQLADLPDRAAKALGMGGTELMAKARAMVEKAAGGAVEARLAAENASLRTQMEAIQKQVAELMQSKGVPAPVAAPAENDEPAGPSAFDSFSDDDLKAYIKDATGSGVRGQPSRATLLRMAEEIVAKDRESEAA
jgi:hypothetical protein